MLDLPCEDIALLGTQLCACCISVRGAAPRPACWRIIITVPSKGRSARSLRRLERTRLGSHAARPRTPTPTRKATAPGLLISADSPHQFVFRRDHRPNCRSTADARTGHRPLRQRPHTKPAQLSMISDHHKSPTTHRKNILHKYICTILGSHPGEPQHHPARTELRPPGITQGHSGRALAPARSFKMPGSNTCLAAGSRE